MRLKHVIYCGLCCLAGGGVAGFLTGRYTAERMETGMCVREQTVTGTVEIVEPVGVETPELPVLPVRMDTVYVDRVMYVREVVDTAAIIADYELKRSYVVPLFDNQYGKLDLSLSTQYNRLGALSYDFIPVTKVVYREKTWRPFACLTYGSLGYVGAGAGIFYKSTGISIQYLTDFKKNGFGISVVRMF